MNTTLNRSWADMPRPIVCLAPMDGITDSAFRRLVRGFSAEVVLFSEFTSADGFLRSERLRQRLVYDPVEHPYFVQLFGNNPEAFREAALVLEQQGVAGVDINMGCPSRKIVHSQHGSDLMRNVQQACDIVTAVAGATRMQVSVKTRLGWNNADNLIPFASALVDAGASLITIHGRTYDQGFSGRADWSPIYALKEALSVPVLGNGDVSHRDDGLARMGNLDGFMIGRAAIGNPWAFLPEAQRTPSLQARVDIMRRHYELMRQDRPPRRAVLEFRKHMVGYLRGFDLAKSARISLLQAPDEAALLQRLELLAQGPHVLARAG